MADKQHILVLKLLLNVAEDEFLVCNITKSLAHGQNIEAMQDYEMKSQWPTKSLWKH